jgi:hypothetical protein
MNQDQKKLRLFSRGSLISWGPSLIKQKRS